jgi:hypothetical protein
MPQHKLDYQTRPANSPRKPLSVVAALYVVGGMLITPVAGVLAIASGNMGHGGYGFARLLFPYSMLLTLATGGTITNPLIALAAAQFPIYGMLLCISTLISRRFFYFAAIGIAAIHLLAAAVCFSGMIPNFS